ncbi:hypothetical protein [Pseudofulvibacter geojedonensis]|uniref:Uncharacterized protein n=1 Tax=Pseudofulvibacter geojedonensis TaxID=1123758 RepID=A0ABW3HZU2_9FLAO
MKEKFIDKINLCLILISFILACLLPFELFLIGYAVLGPLHYLTETNWIVNKNYFVANNYWKYIVVVGALIYSIPYICSLSYVKSFFANEILEILTVKLSVYNNDIMFFIFITSFLFVFTNKNKALIISLLVTLMFSIFALKSDLYMLLNGVLLPTIIHVYIFTIFFMIYGFNKNKIGIVNIGLMILLPLSLFWIDTDVFNYHFSDFVKNTYTSNSFHYLNANLAKLFGVYKDLGFFFYEKIDLKIQIFISFAYMYHYLNWFSKTTIIGWHKQLTKRKSIGIALVWLTILCCYIYNYRLGLVMSVFLSVLHVMLEFPLNMITVKSLFKK